MVLQFYSSSIQCKETSYQELIFSKHILFYTIYLLQDQKLNPRNHSEQELNMHNFVHATENDVNMYAKFECLDFYRFFVIKYSKI
jgi:hypothetical protein